VAVSVGMGVPVRVDGAVPVGVTRARGAVGRALVPVGVPAAPRVLVCPLSI
jgi:hypothetical protein